MRNAGRQAKLVSGVQGHGRDPASMLAIIGRSGSNRPIRERLKGRLQRPGALCCDLTGMVAFESGREMSGLSHIIARYEVVSNAHSLNNICKEAHVLCQHWKMGSFLLDATWPFAGGQQLVQRADMDGKFLQ